MAKITEETRNEIRRAFANLNGSGVPEHVLSNMHADHAIGLLENQQEEWFEPEPKTDPAR